MNEQVRMGRPKKELETPKKGNASWKPSNLGDITGKEAGYRYRRVRKDDDNIAKKKDEQWEMVSKINAPSAAHVFPDGRPDEGHQVDSVVGGRDWVLMRIPEEIAQERDAYINAKSDRLTKALGSQTRKDLGNNVPMHGAITHNQRGVKTVIE